MKLEFCVPGPPVPWQRVGFGMDKASGKRRSFKPARTNNYENHVRLHALAARCKTSRWPWQDKSARFSVTIEIHRSAKRGDWDNFAKAITDACNNVLWPDDRQIIFATVQIYDGIKGLEHATVTVEVWQNGT